MKSLENRKIFCSLPYPTFINTYRNEKKFLNF